MNGTRCYQYTAFFSSPCTRTQHSGRLKIWIALLTSSRRVVLQYEPAAYIQQRPLHFAHSVYYIYKFRIVIMTWSHHNWFHRTFSKEHSHFVIPFLLIVSNIWSHTSDERTRRLLNIISHNALKNRLFQKIRSSGVSRWAELTSLYPTEKLPQ